MDALPTLAAIVSPIMQMDVSTLIAATEQVLQPTVIFLITAAVLYGFIFGVVPGLGAAIGVALLLPLTLDIPALPAIAMLAAVYPAAVYSGSITSILLNTPGDPTSTVTTFDGYPMTRQGEGDKALGISLAASTLGGLFGTTVLLFLAPPFAAIALGFGPSHFFAIGIFGIVILVLIARGALLKGLVAAAIGLLLSIVGYSVIRGIPRFTFGVEYLETGVPIIPVVVGLFAVSEAMMLIYEGGQIAEEDDEGAQKRKNGGTLKGRNALLENAKERVSGLISGIFNALSRPLAVLRAAVIGTAVGTLPGSGATIANFVSYYVAKSTSKFGENFGTGSIEGVIAAEASNNATTSAALVPTLVLGIPGSVTTAILLGALLLKNIRIGPQLFVRTPELAYAIIISLFFANIIIFFIGFSLSTQLGKIAELPVEVIAPAVIFVSILGTFVWNFTLGDTVATLCFGVLGFGARKLGYPPVSVVFGLILGPIVEDAYLQGLSLSGGDPIIFVGNPLAASLLGGSVLLLIYQTLTTISDTGVVDVIRERAGGGRT